MHAAFSLYWALGGRWLLNTVGKWALDWADRAPVAAGLVLAGVTVAKLAAAALPLAVASGRLSWSRGWQVLMWAGAVGLVVYGTANAVGAWLVLAGLVTVEGAREMPALVGHAVLWDPLFAAWGVLLALGLRQLRRAGQAKLDGVAPAALAVDQDLS